jgi:hypothetical protein
MPVDYQDKDYQAALPRWRACRAAVEGEDAIKLATTDHLPMPNADDQSPKNKARYAAYIKRANFIPYTGHSLASSVGSIFKKQPTFDLPKELEYVLQDTDGGGLALTQLAKAVVSDVMTVGRFGMLAEYPETTGLRTKDQDEVIKARVATYPAESIFGRKEIKRDGQKIQTQVRLIEYAEVAVDDFESKQEIQYRVLSLRDGVYSQQLYNEKNEPIGEEIIPTDYKGNTFDRIPFVYCGSEENNPDIDSSPIYGLARVNIGHYRNSADYEEGIYMLGQPTLVFTSDIGQEAWEARNPNGLTVGSREALYLGTAGDAKLLQMESNGAASEAMTKKEEQMRSISNQLSSSSGANQTAEAARINASAETSVLSTVADNASSAITDILKLLARIMGADESKISFQLNKEFFDKTFTAQDSMALNTLYESTHIAQSDLRGCLRQSGVIAEGRTDEMIDKEIAENPPLLFDMGITGQAGDDNGDNADAAK